MSIDTVDEFNEEHYPKYHVDAVQHCIDTDEIVVDVPKYIIQTINSDDIGLLINQLLFQHANTK